MGWFASLFSSDSSQRSRKGQALSSTHEAFSLPTSSPVFSTHPDAFDPSALNTPDVDAVVSPSSYTYPPQGPSSYGYVPTSAGIRTQQGSASLLPTHMDPMHTPLSPKFLYPPLSNTWNRLRTWLNREYPELGDTLNYGILPQDLADIEMQFGFALPAAVRESYLCVDGQEAESAAGCAEGLFFGLTLLPLEGVLEEWRFWREVDDDSTTGANPNLREVMQSIPPGWVRKEYSQRGWIPLIADKAGNYVGVDLNPGEGGSVGQVIVFGRDFDTKVVLWRGDGSGGWAKFLAAFVEELESGEGFEIGANEASEGSEDDLGYESYFYDGNGRGQGDGGGDIGSGGLRLTGEYRGWNVFEAWGDRSVRKWHEAGVIPDTILSPPMEDEDLKGKAVDNVGLGLSQGPGAEVAIPVLQDATDSIPPPTVTALNTSNSNTPRTQSSPIPASTSLTKPPAPLPVELPTASDIVNLPSPPDSAHSSIEDLESGRHTGMRELREDIGLVSSTRKIVQPQPALRRETSDGVGSALPLSPPPPMSPSPSSAKVAPSSTLPELLVDLAPVLEPSSSISSNDQIPTQQSLIADTSDSIIGLSDTVEDEADPSTTIRLVGGGGTAGVVVESPIETSHPEDILTESTKDSDTASVTSIALDASGKKGHKKTKSSLAGFKKLGQLGGLRKKDSVSSMRDGTSPSATT